MPDEIVLGRRAEIDPLEVAFDKVGHVELFVRVAVVAHRLIPFFWSESAWQSERGLVGVFVTGRGTKDFLVLIVNIPTGSPSYLV